MTHPKGAAKVRCGYWWERRTPGRRYVNARGQCTRETWHQSGYCSEHRYCTKACGGWMPNRNDAPKGGGSE